MLNALNFYGKYIPTKEARQPIIATHPSPSLSPARGEGLWPSRSSRKTFSFGEAHRSNTECKKPDWMGMLPKSINGFRVISLNLPQSYKISYSKQSFSLFSVRDFKSSLQQRLQSRRSGGSVVGWWWHAGRGWGWRNKQITKFQLLPHLLPVKM